MVETPISRIALGSVQWGMNYGVANVTGQPGHVEVTRILAIARSSGVSLIDTAFTYGEAENVIGELDEDTSSFEIVTKTGPVDAGEAGAAAARRIESAFKTSLMRLRRPSVYGLLVHNPEALLGASGEHIWGILVEAKARGLVGKIGVSVYSPRQLDAAMEKYEIDIVQLPFNIYDRRFLRNGTLAAARANGVEVHVRSAFLQGLLLMDAAQLPTHFASIRAHHTRFQDWCRDRKTTPLAAALRFALEGSGADRVVIGAEKAAQLSEILLAMGGGAAEPVPDTFEIQREEIVNPSLWKL